MIKKFKLYKESLLNKLSGPTPEESWSVIKNLHPDSMLMKSCKVGLLDGVKIALEKGAYIHIDEDYPVREASMNGYLEIVKYLVEQGADIHADNEYAVRFAAKYGHLEVLKYLEEKGGDIHFGGEKPLKYACETGNLHIVKYLVEKGADVNSGNGDVLFTASYYGHLDVVKYLVEQGADVTKDRYYVLRYVRNNGYIDIVKYLEEYMKKKGLKESLLNKLQGPTDEELRDNLSKMKILDWYKKVKELGLDSSYLPDNEKIRKKLSELNLYDWIKTAGRLGLDYTFLPDNDETKQKLKEQPLMKSIDNIFSLGLDEEFLPTKEEIENQYLSKKINTEEYYDICVLLKIDFMSKDKIYESIYKHSFNEEKYRKYENDPEGLFNLLTSDVKLITKSRLSYWYYGKYSVIYFKYEPNTKYLYVNPSFLKTYLLLFGEEKLNEYLNYFFGEQFNSHKLQGNVYLSKLEVGVPWIY